MKIIKKFMTLSLALVAFSFVNVSAQGLSGDVQKTELAQKIYKKILGLPNYEVFDHIGFSIDGDTVTLTGKVRNGINRSTAGSVVKNMPGVGRVVNNIEVLSLSRYDEQIRRNLYASLSNTGGLSRYLWTVNPPVRLIVDRGNITLEGTVQNRGDFNTMYLIARGVPNSFNVTNNLKVENDVVK